MPTHAETRILSFTPEQMFDLVADVERYPEFLPWCIGARVKRRRGAIVDADLIIGYKMIREKFTSRVTLDRPRRIDVDYVDGPMRHLNNHWVFKPHADGCEIDFFVDFAFRSRIFERMLSALFNEAYRRMVGAFERRAHELYIARANLRNKG